MPLQLKLSVPTNQVADMTVEYVQLPSEEGSMGVLQNHAPLRAALQPGVMTARDLEHKNHYFFVSSGLAMIKDNVITVLADSAERAEDIDEARAQKAGERARERIQSPEPHTDIARAEIALAKSIARINAKHKLGALH
ncbi:MAG: ATP synthase F1 subunit epsilon [Candidatus Omnitrophica bacterium]|nr:ATP synthase F1 subunit epsilon [Candidatus Omnitrophota bacterium]